jgi:hypothetical protein
MKAFIDKFPFFIILVLAFCCQCNNGTKSAESDFKNGIIRIYVFGELMGYERQYSKLLKQHNIELYHIRQSESDKLNIMQKYNEYMVARVFEKNGVNFLDSLKSTICFPTISRIAISLYGIDTAKYKKVDIAYTFETNDSVLLEVFRNYNNWIEAPNYRCIRNARIELFFNNSTIDTLEAVISSKCNLVECKSLNTTTYKFMPLDLIKKLQVLLVNVQLKDGWSRL